MFQALRLRTHTYDAFRRHARTYLEPAIIHSWNKWHSPSKMVKSYLVAICVQTHQVCLVSPPYVFAMMNYSFELPSENVSYFRTLSKIWQLYNDELEDQ